MENKKTINVPDKFSKKYFKKLQKKIFLIILLPALIYSYFHFKNENDSNNALFYRLKTNGVITGVNAEFQKHWDTGYYYYYFITKNGQKIEKSGKCGNIETFAKDYQYLQVIYNTTNPKEFMEYPYFQSYSTGFPFFWLIIATVFYSLFTSVFISLGYLVVTGKFKMLINK